MSEQQTPPPYDSQQPSGQSTPGPQLPNEPFGAPFFRWVRGLGVQRTGERWIAGVCAGIGRRVGLDPVIVRGIAVVLFFFGGVGLVAYLALWLLLPGEDDRIHVEDAFQGHATAGTWIGIVTFGLLLIWPGPGWRWVINGPWGAGVDPYFAVLRVLWWLAVTVGVIWLVVWLIRRANQAGPSAQQVQASVDEINQQARTATENARQQARAATERARAAAQARNERARIERLNSAPGGAAVSIALGIALIAGVGVGWATRQSWASPQGATVLGIAAGLVVLGLAIVALGFAGRRGGFLNFMAVVTAIALTIAVPASSVNIDTRAHTYVMSTGSWRLTPEEVVDAENAPAYQLIMASGYLDLSDLGDVGDEGAANPPRLANITLTVIMSSTELTVPQSGTFRITADIIAGSLDTSGITNGSRRESGGLRYSDVVVVSDGRIVPAADLPQGPHDGVVDVYANVTAGSLELKTGWSANS